MFVPCHISTLILLLPDFQITKRRKGLESNHNSGIDMLVIYLKVKIINLDKDVIFDRSHNLISLSIKVKIIDMLYTYSKCHAKGLSCKS